MRSEKKALWIFLCLGLLAVAMSFYLLFYRPISNRIAELRNEIRSKEREVLKNREDRITASELDTRILSFDERISGGEDRLFFGITQADIPSVLSRFYPDGEKAEDRTMTLVSVEGGATGEFGRGDYEILLAFRGSYRKAADFLNALRRYEKDITITNLRMDLDDSASYFEGSAIRSEGRDGGGERSEADLRQHPFYVRLRLRFHSYSKTDASIETAVEAIRTHHDRSAETGFLSICSQFFSAARKAREVRAREFQISRIVRDLENAGVRMPAEDFAPPTKRDSHTRSVLYGFEDGGYAFEGADKDVSGKTTYSDLSPDGTRSAELYFDFMIPKNSNTAYLTFDRRKTVLSPSEFIVLHLYSYAFTNHEIGLLVQDDEGRMFKIRLTDGVNQIGWTELKSALPEEITYPCHIQKIYVEGRGDKQDLRGHYLFDLLESEQSPPLHFNPVGK